MGIVPKRFRLSSGKEGNRVENTGFYDKVMKLLKAVLWSNTQKSHLYPYLCVQSLISPNELSGCNSSTCEILN